MARIARPARRCAAGCDRVSARCTGLARLLVAGLGAKVRDVALGFELDVEASRRMMASANSPDSASPVSGRSKRSGCLFAGSSRPPVAASQSSCTSHQNRSASSGTTHGVERTTRCPSGRSKSAAFAYRTSGSIQWNELHANTASKRAPAGSNASKDVVEHLHLLECRHVGRRPVGQGRSEFDRGDRDLPLSKGTGRLARTGPISSRCDVGPRPASSTMSSKTAAGHTGRVRS